MIRQGIPRYNNRGIACDDATPGMSQIKSR
jgi:hypothetical protein